MLPGKKSYIVSAIYVVFAGLGFLIGEIDGTDAMRMVLEGGGLAALRNGIAKRIGA